jgi:hypothetical protein
LPLLLAGTEADACVKRDEKQIRSIEQQVSRQRNEAERQVGHYENLINSCLILCNHYMLLLWNAVGNGPEPGDLPDFQVDAIFESLTRCPACSPPSLVAEDISEIDSAHCDRGPFV